MHRCYVILLALFALFLSSITASAENSKETATRIYAKKNLVAWCIVPFDSKKRGPEERAAMLEQLGIMQLAYDYRKEHISTFDAELDALKKHHIKLTAWWFPGHLNKEALDTLALFKRHGVTPQLWVSGRGAPESKELEGEWIQKEVDRLKPIAEAAAKIGCKLALYNHGGWFGEPENQIKIIQAINLPNVGIVYNLHHAHHRLDDFSNMMKIMKPYLFAFNLNGMVKDGDKHGQKILPIAAGNLDLSLLKIISDSGYKGPIGILNHTNKDAKIRLQDNLNGLEWMVRKLDHKPVGPKPVYQSWKPKSKTSKIGGHRYKGHVDYRRPPITVECRVTYKQKATYNILVACDEKKSADHWEIFTMPHSGFLTVYMPGKTPNHIKTKTPICDGQPHNISMIYEPSSVRLFVDGKKIADQTIKSLGHPSKPGGFAIGRLVEGGLSNQGNFEWVRITKGVREIPLVPPTQIKKDKNTIKIWTFPIKGKKKDDHDKKTSLTQPGTAPSYDEKLVLNTVIESKKQGVSERGVAVFASTKFACISCHKIGKHGGTVGPDLTNIGKERTAKQIVESLYWPKREVKPEFVSVSVLTEDGKQYSGYKIKSDEHRIVLKDPASGKLTKLETDEIEDEVIGSTLMPEGLTSAMTLEQQLDLIHFLVDLGKGDSVSQDVIAAVLEHAHGHGPAKFPYKKEPMYKEDWPNWDHRVNRDRIYDFYTKEAEYFRKQKQTPPVLPPYPGLDGGDQGHWGNQNEQSWASGQWNQSKLGNILSGVFHADGITVPRGICVRLGDNGEISACFNPDTLQFESVWSGGFVKFSAVRHGFLHGLRMDGTPVRALKSAKSVKPDKPFVYHGFYRNGKRIVFSYSIDGVKYLDAPWVDNGKFVHIASEADKHPDKSLTTPAELCWPQILETKIIPGTARPYAIDTIELPFKNQWNSLFYCGGHDFLPDGSAYICTMQGDVWHVTGLTDGLNKAHWKRYASGLHQPLGLVVAKNKVYVLCRDQIVRLNDLNQDGEADFYECFSNAFETSPSGHAFICGLQRDKAGNFFLASSNQGVVRISPDGKKADVLAVGFRNPDGLGILPDGTLTVPCSEGTWTPASMICEIRPPKKNRLNDKSPYYGYGKPLTGKVPELPLAYLPRGLDNSSGGQVYVSSNRWGPLEGQSVHLSFGAGSHFLLLRDKVDGQTQGAIVPLPGAFNSGSHRGRFNPADGQLYVTGMTGWGSYTPDAGCFQRVRYTGDPVQLPVAFHVYENGVSVTFTEPLTNPMATKLSSHFAQCWNYRYSGAYGSPEYSTKHQGMSGHDSLKIKSTHLLSDGRTLFLEIPELQPVNQLHLRLNIDSGKGHSLFITAHNLDVPFTNFKSYQPVSKKVNPHPILADIALAKIRVPNPWRLPIKGARAITLRTGKNLSFDTKEIVVKAGEKIQLTLMNPDMVPHNWALVKPGSLQRVGKLANHLVADPEAYARQYIPKSSDVLFYTDVVDPKKEFVIHFQAPAKPGRYPYLCTFPGHWMVMNGVLIVE